MPHVHNGMHHNTRLLDAFARAVGEKAGAQEFTGVERFGETLTPIIDLWALPEWALLRGEVLFSRRVSSAAVAARFSTIEFVNPVGSPVIAVVGFQQDFNITLEVAIDAGPAIGANPVVTGGTCRDSRYPPGELSRCRITSGDAAAGASLVQYRSNAPNIPCPVQWILAPGGRLFVTTDAVNQAVGLSFHWIERVLLPTEDRA